MDTPWLTLEEAAAYVRLNPEVFRRRARLDKIRHGRAGSLYRFKAEHLDEYLMSRGSGRRKS